MLFQKAPQAFYPQFIGITEHLSTRFFIYSIASNEARHMVIFVEIIEGSGVDKVCMYSTVLSWPF